MGSRVWQIEKERFDLVLLNKTDRLTGEFLCQQAAIKRIFDQIVTTPEFVRIVMARCYEIGIIKSLMLRQKRLGEAPVSKAIRDGVQTVAPA